jgi:hypothetical protein
MGIPRPHGPFQHARGTSQPIVHTGGSMPYYLIFMTISVSSSDTGQGTHPTVRQLQEPHIQKFL